MIKSTPTASPDDDINTNIDPNGSEVPCIGIDPDKNIESSPTASPDDTDINVDPIESEVPDVETDPSMNDQKPSQGKKTPFKRSYSRFNGNNEDEPEKKRRKM